MNIYELNDPLWVTTPLGDGVAIFIIDYGIYTNTCWVVALKEDGQIKHFDANDIKLQKNWTYALALKNERK